LQPASAHTPIAAATANVQLLYVFVTLSSPEKSFEWQSFVGAHVAPLNQGAPADSEWKRRQT